VEDEESVDSMWDGSKSLFNESAEATFGQRRKEVKEWMMEDTWEAIEEKKKL
jgi:hypothetical protein